MSRVLTFPHSLPRATRDGTYWTQWTPECKSSTAITTNKSVKDWPGIFAGDEAMTAAILDRLLHKSVVLNIRGRSYRLQDLEKLLK